MSDTPLGHPGGQTRREFIRKLLLTTAYAAPLVATFSTGGAALGQSADPGTAGDCPPGQVKMGEVCAPTSRRMMSPMSMGSDSGMMRQGNPGNLWK